MAAIIEPRRLPVRPAPRPALRLVSAHDGRPVEAPVDLGFGPAHLAAAVAAVVVAVLLALAISGGAFARLAPGPADGAAPAAASGAVTAPGGTQVTVQAGDTLWSIAQRVQPDGDVRGLVDQLTATYGTGPLQVGQQLTVPA
ncbi:MAG TPA: LysM peptidoglycan-binding domain-containing protein [Acidimicrobiales bacterium]|nr:LysM peptidoglycan-binding domain-containing protein [Acidimicrobiales bacterium]